MTTLTRYPMPPNAIEATRQAENRHGDMDAYDEWVAAGSPDWDELLDEPTGPGSYDDVPFQVMAPETAARIRAMTRKAAA